MLLASYTQWSGREAASATTAPKTAPTHLLTPGEDSEDSKAEMRADGVDDMTISQTLRLSRDSIYLR